VSGEAGIGKTALLACFARLHAPPVRLFWGGCDALFTPRPLAPLLDMAWSHGGKLAEHLAQGSPRHDVFHAFFEELQHPRPPRWSWSRTCTGPTRRRWTCSSSWAAARSGPALSS
jgi:hypothetical protein